MNTRDIDDALNNSNASITSECKNRIDGINTRRGEGLPYREDAEPFTPKPYTSKILASRLPNGENKIDGHNGRRGEGLPYQEVSLKEYDIELTIFDKKM